MHKKIQHQSGASLIELLLVLMVISGIAVYQTEQTIKKLEKDYAQEIGNNIVLYAKALSNWMGDNQFSYLPDNISVGDKNEYKGLMFLKHKSCGGDSDKEYIPCYFTEYSLGNGLSYSVVIENRGGVFFASKTFGPLKFNSRIRSDLTAEVANTIKMAAYSGDNLNVIYDPTGLGIPNSAVKIEVTSGGSDFVNIDGSKYMQGILSFESGISDQNKKIENVSKIYGSNNSYVSGRNGVEIDRDAYVSNWLVTDEGSINKGSKVITGELSINEAITVESDGFLKSHAGVENDLNSYKNVLVGSNLEIKDNFNAMNNISSSNDIHSKDKISVKFLSVSTEHREGGKCSIKSITTNKEGFAMHCIKNKWEKIKQ